MANVRVGVVGVGNMGSHHAKMISAGSVPGAGLAAVADVRPERLAWAKEALGEGVGRFATADEMMESGSVDAVVIATPHYDHPPIAVKAFGLGLHVLSEKPAGVYTRQVREMNEAAAKSGRVFALMFQQRTLARHRKMKELVDSGELGPLVRVVYLNTAWFRSQSYYDSGGWRATWAGEGGGVLINQCPHNLDLLQWICGMPKRVRAFCAFGKHHDIEVEDDVTAYFEYENGATGVFVTSTGEAPGTNRLEVSGDRGRLVLDGGSITFHRTRVSASDFCRNYKGGFGHPEAWKCEIPPGEGDDGHLGILTNWVQAIRRGTPLIARGEEGIRSLELSNAMLLSTWTDGWVDLPIDEDLFHAKIMEKAAASTYRRTASGDAVLDVKGTH